MRASETTIVPSNRARVASGQATIGTDGLRKKIAARAAQVEVSRSGPAVQAAVVDDADYFVHPFVD